MYENPTKCCVAKRLNGDWFHFQMKNHDYFQAIHFWFFPSNLYTFVVFSVSQNHVFTERKPPNVIHAIKLSLWHVIKSLASWDMELCELPRPSTKNSFVLIFCHSSGKKKFLFEILIAFAFVDIFSRIYPTNRSVLLPFHFIFVLWTWDKLS